MNFWTAVVIIVAIAAFANMRMAKYRYQSGTSPARQADTPPRELELERELAELKERLKVLERIATDDRQTRSIASEIESLRDK